MATLNDFRDHYRKLIAQMRDDIKSMESGQWAMFDLQDGKRVDITADCVNENKRRVKKLEDIIAAYEKRDA